MTRAKTLVIALGLVAIPIAGGSAFSQDPTGTWLTEKGDAQVAVAPCQDAFCGTVIWLKQPTDAKGNPVTDIKNPDPAKRTQPMVGTQIALDMKPTPKPNEWAGQFYNAKDGKIYKGKLILVDAAKLRVEGCLLVFCGGETWTRVPEPPPAAPAPPMRRSNR